MKTLGFQKYTRGTESCMKTLTMATKDCGQVTSNETYSSDILLSRVKTAEEVMSEGVDYCGPAKTSHNIFRLATLEKLMKDWP